MQNILGHIDEPKICPSCQKKWMMKMVHNRSIYLNKQIVKMQVHTLAHRMHVLHSKQKDFDATPTLVHLQRMQINNEHATCRRTRTPYLRERRRTT